MYRTVPPEAPQAHRLPPWVLGMALGAVAAVVVFVGLQRPTTAALLHPQAVHPKVCLGVR